MYLLWMIKEVTRILDRLVIKLCLQLFVLGNLSHGLHKVLVQNVLSFGSVNIFRLKLSQTIKH